jgi:hypothetical protein
MRFLHNPSKGHGAKDPELPRALATGPRAAKTSANISMEVSVTTDATHGSKPHMDGYLAFPIRASSMSYAAVNSKPL